MGRIFRIGKRLLAVAAFTGGGLALSFTVVDITQENFFKKKILLAAHSEAEHPVHELQTLPSRSELLQNLRSTKQFDVLVIGGGATGAGVALDSQTRGLSTALVECDDFSSGTSSRSTKLIHGGVRYLQSAVLKADYEQYRMVKEALFERANLLKIAPHLASALPLMLPIYSWWQVPYYYIGIKMYDFVAGKRRLKPSFYISKNKALELFPLLKKESLCGALIYYDGQHNDARMNLSIILTAIRRGSQCLNHAEVVDLLKEHDHLTGQNVVRGAKVKDNLTGQVFDIRAKCVINATGSFCDKIRLMDNPKSSLLVVPSQGVHVILPKYYCPMNTGLFDPQTSDGRVIFFLPWENMTIAGTTDSPCCVTDSPAPGETDIAFILKEIRSYLASDISVRRGDVLSAWAGIRPLIVTPSLTALLGGKWTTYRHMAEETIDKAIEVAELKPTGPCVTTEVFLEGGTSYNSLLYIRLVQDFGLELEVAKHLASTYGDKAVSVAKLAKLTGKRYPVVGKRLHEEFPYLEAEIIYAIREYACTAVDFIARRSRLAFLNTHAALEALPKVIEIMGDELHWSEKEKQVQMEQARKFIDIQMGQDARLKAFEESPINLTPEEHEKALAERNERLDEGVLHGLLDDVDLNKNGEIELREFLLLYSGLKGGSISQNRLARYLGEYLVITPERSGGGV
ncbi:unnamed protein product [Soboliphyme baturini]|uniref:Glycerol-3-phosphate dehydrogenase n=1 Tax=Soboliphyme baturini TaxID=241478 RepID=A0A183IM09_9BILA|nr:unnamed protein product [Soboliphyme baturini]